MNTDTYVDVLDCRRDKYCCLSPQNLTEFIMKNIEDTKSIECEGVCVVFNGMQVVHHGVPVVFTKNQLKQLNL